MLKEERQHWILERLGTDKKLTLVKLSQLLGVSYDSIRRDVIELEEQGLLKKIHGAAIANTYLPMKKRQRLGIQNNEIEVITHKAQCLFKSGEMILMDGGSTNLYIAELIDTEVELTIVTNNLPLALSLADHPNLEIILLGGTYLKNYQITMGNEVAQQLLNLKPDWYIMGVVGVHQGEGLTIRHYEESLLKRRMFEAARKVAVCATTEKRNSITPYRICGFRDIDLLITGSDTPTTDWAEWQGHGVEII